MAQKDIGFVVELKGSAEIKSVEGINKILQIGDKICEGDLLTTGIGTEILLEFYNGRSLELGAETVVLLDESVFSNLPSLSDDRADQLAELQQLIIEGLDLSDLQAPAAGNAPVAADGLNAASIYTRDGLEGIVETEGQPLEFDGGFDDEDSRLGEDDLVRSAPQIDPVVEITIDSISGDNIINAAESASLVAITGSVSGDVSVGDPITITVNGTDYVGTLNAGNVFSIEVPGAELLADNTVIASIATGDADGEVFTSAASIDYVVDTITNASISLNSITSDDIINLAESNGVINITGSVGDDAGPGDTVSVQVNGVTYSGVVGDDNSFSIPVSGTELSTQTLIEVSVTGSDSAGNPFTSTTSQNYLVNLTNSNPDAVDDSGTTTEDVGIDIDVTLNDSDSDGGVLSVDSVSQGSNGIVVIKANGVINYLPDPDFFGNDSFTYTITDGQGGFDTGTVNVAISGVNDPAVVSFANLAIAEVNAPLSTGGTLTATDIDNPDNSFIAASTIGAIGDFTIDTDGNWTFTANSSFDSLNVGDSVNETFNVTSTDGTSSTVQITINGTNDAATVSSASQVLTETDTALSTSGTLSSTDIDNDNDSFTAVSITGTIGDFNIDTDGNWTFTANSTFDSLNVGDSVNEVFSVTSEDGTPGTVEITINGTNDAATISSASEFEVETNAVISTGGTITATDPDDADNSFLPQTNIAGSNGVFNLATDGSWTYVSNSASEFDYLNDGDSVIETFAIQSVDGSPSNVTVTITGTNDAPVITITDTTVAEDVPQVIGNTNDFDGTIVGSSLSALNGTVTIAANGEITYSPDLNFTGTDTVTLSFTDNNGATTTQIVPITVDDGNDAPIITVGDTAVVEDVGQVIATASDFDGTIVSSSLSAPNGTVTISAAGDIIYTPDADYFGTDTVSVSVTDDDGATTVQSIPVNVSAVNDAATVSSAIIDLTETDTALTATGTLTSVDVDNDNNSFTAVSITGAIGNFDIDVDGNWNFTANSTFDNLNGGESVNETFNVTSEDGTPSTVQITINGINDAPTIDTATGSTLVENGAAVGDVVATFVASDLDGDAVTYSITSGNDDGYFEILDDTTGVVTLTVAGAAAVNADTLVDATNTLGVTANDGTVDSAEATADILFDGINDAPTIDTATGSTLVENGAAVGDVVATFVASDLDGDAVTYSITSGNDDGYFEILDDTTGVVTLTVAGAAAVNADTLVDATNTLGVTANDGTVDSAEATADILFDGINDAPTIDTATGSTLVENGAAVGDVVATFVASDLDGDAVTYSITSGNDDGYFEILDDTTGVVTLTVAGAAAVNADTLVDATNTLGVTANDGTVDSAEATADILFDGINDAPTIDTATGSTLVENGAAVGDVVATFVASDLDGDAVTYSITSGNDDGYFEILDDTTGVVTLTVAGAAAVNADTLVDATNTLGVTANDGTVDSAEATADILFDGINDAPTIDTATGSTLVENGAAVGDVVATFVASDLDGDAVTYSITSGNDDGYFEILDDTTGVVTLTVAGAAAVNADTLVDATNTLGVTANDGTVDSAEATADILFDGINDAPTIDTATGSTLVENGAAVGDVVATFVASDLDGDAVTYSITSGNDDGYFEILDDTTGVVTLTVAGAAAVNADTLVDATNTLGVTANDGTVDSAEATADILFDGINDAPTIDTATGSTLVENGAAVGDVVATFVASDLDGDAVTYSITSGNDDGYFEILDDTTGVVTLTVAGAAAVNADTLVDATNTLGVTANDGTVDSAEATADILFDGINDAPTIDTATGSTLVENGAAVGDVVATFVASDLDGDAVTYSITSGNDDGYFEILDDTTGVVTLTVAGAAAVNADTLVDATNTLGVTANDGTVDSAEATADILFDGINDAPTIDTATGSTLVENGAAVGDVVATFVASDLDGDAVTYSITSGNDDGYFEILDDTTGVVTLTVAGAAAVNADTLVDATNTLGVTANDGTVDSAEATADILFDGINDAPTIDTATGSTLVENGAAVGDVVATFVASDLDGDAVTYSITSGNDDGYFEILDDTTGVVTLTVAGAAAVNADTLVDATNTLGVTANDGTVDSAEATADILFDGINDAPTIDTATGSTLVENGAAVGDVVATFVASDLDGDAVTYSITSGNDDGYFEILDDTTGVVTLTVAGAAAVNADTLVDATNTLGVTANDGTVDSAEATADILFDGINDAPTIDTATGSTLVENGAAVGDVVATFVASDLDGDAVTYSITSGNDDGYFEILDDTTGVVTLTVAGAAAVNADTLVDATNTLGVTANDGTVDSAEATADILFDGINDAPTIDTATGSTLVENGAAVGDVVATFVASDLDGDAVTYSITSGNDDGYFEILDDTTGVVTLTVAGAAAVNADTLVDATNTLGVTANDGTVDSAEATADILFDGINDAPTIDTATGSTLVENGAAVGDVVATFVASDLDGDAVTYSITSGNDDGYFEILDDTTGVVTLTVAGAAAVNADTLVDATNTLGVTANDGTVDSAEATADILFDGINDAPTIDTATGSTLVENGAAVGDVVATFVASDLDGDAVTYSITSGNDDGYFEILDDTTGVVTLTVAGAAAVNADTLVDATNTLGVTANDGTVDSAEATADILFDGINDAPTIDTATGSTLVENGAAVGDVVATFVASDLDGDAVTYSITSGNDDGYFEILDDTTGVVTLTVAGAAAVNADTLVDATNTLGVTANDGTVDSAEATADILFDGINDAPTIDTATGSTLVENGAAVGDVVATFVASDLDGDAVTYSITSGNDDGYFEILDDTTGVVTLTVAGAAAVNADTLVDATNTLGVTANDGTVDSAEATADILFDGINDAPTIDLDANNSSTATGNDYTTSFTEGGAAVAISDIDILISDVDDTDIKSATITLTNNESGDFLTVGSLPAGITASSYNPLTGVVTLSGTASLADYQSAISAIQFENAGNGSGTDRVIEIVVNDGNSDSAVATTTVSVNTIPTITIDDVLIQEPGSSTVTMTFTVTIDEAPSADLTFDYQTVGVSATAGSDFQNIAITQGTILLGETTTIIMVTINSDSDVFEGDETFTVDLSNFSQPVNFSTSSHTTVGGIQGVGTIGADNGPPEANDDSYITSEGIDLVISNLLSNDVLVDGATLTSFTQGSNGSVTDNGDGTFTYSPAGGFTGTDNFSYILTDLDGQQDMANVMVTVSADPTNPPIVENVPDIAYVENDSPTNILSGINITDSDSSNLSSVVVTIDGYIGTQDLIDYITMGTSVTVNETVSGNTLELTLSGGADINEYLAVLGTVTYANSSENPSSSVRDIKVEAFDDQYNNLFGSDVGTINVTPVNDAPDVFNSDVFVVEDSTNSLLNITAPTDPDTDDSLLVITVASLPGAVGTVRLGIDGPAGSAGDAVLVGQELTMAELTSLEFDAGATAGSGTFTYSVDDGELSTTGSTTISVGSTNADVGTVYESGLADGTGVGGSAEVSGNLFANDPSAGNSVDSIDFNATNYTATAGIITVATAIGTLTVYADSTSNPGFSAGDYTYVLDTADGSSNDVDEVFTYNFTNVTGFSNNLTITVIDDVPVANNLVEEVPESEEQVFNIILTLDTSGSMNWSLDNNSAPAAGEPSRLDVAKSAIIALSQQFFDQSSQVGITLITFSDNPTVIGDYTNFNSFQTAVNGLTASGATDYNDALDQVETELTADLTGPPAQDPDVRNISYFVSDGVSSTSPVGGGFDTFVNSNGINSFAVGIGPGLASGSADLDFIHNVDSLSAGGGISDSAIIVADINELEAELLNTVPTAFGGNITVNGSIQNVDFGADGGYVQNIVIEIGGTTYTFTFNGSIVTVDPALTGVDIDGSVATIGPAVPGFDLGTFAFDFSDGSYTFSSPDGNAGNQLNFDYTIIDNDGDLATATAIIDIVDAAPTANDDLHSVVALETAEGNVITAQGTDGGPSFGSNFTPFATQGGGVDKLVDDADITSVTFRGKALSLDFDSSAVPAGGSEGTLTWVYSTTTDNLGNEFSVVTVTDSSDNAQLVFNSAGYYEFNPDTTYNPSVQITESFLDGTADNGVTVSTDANGSPVITYNNSTNSGIGVNSTGDSYSDSADDGDNIILTFDNTVYPNGVEDITLDFGWDNGAADVIFYDEFGGTISTVALTGADLQSFAGISDVFSLELTTGPTGDYSIQSITFNTVADVVASVPSAPPEIIQYTLTDTDLQSDVAQLSIYTIDNSISGTVNDDSIVGGDLNDAITGDAGNDSLSGGAGHDTISGGAGADILSGGAGLDNLSGGAGADILSGGADADYLDGGAGDDMLDGGTGDDLLKGSGGDDDIFGGSGSDILEGGQGDDSLYGGSGDDTLLGGEGIDMIFGGQGDDTLSGGAEVDTFVWNSADKGLVGSAASDVITDFQTGLNGDVLDLSDLLQNEEDATSLDSYLNFSYDAGSGDSTISIDVDGTGTFESVQEIVLEGVDLTAGGSLTTDQQIFDSLLSNGNIIVDP